jgi:hypothetical protein
MELLTAQFAVHHASSTPGNCAPYGVGVQPPGGGGAEVGEGGALVGLPPGGEEVGGRVVGGFVGGFGLL